MMGIGMLLWIIVFIGLIILAMKSIQKGSFNLEKKEPSPLDIAKKRLALGEISAQEFEELISKL